MQAGLAGILGIVLALVMSMGGCSGVDESMIEEYAEELGIEPIEIPLDSLDGAGSPGDFDGDAPEKPYVFVETAQECAEGAGVGTFPSFEDVELSCGVPESVVYSYTAAENKAEALCFYTCNEPGILIEKAVFSGSHDIVGDVRAFTHEWAQTVGVVEVSCHGFEDGGVCVANFVDGGYVYAIDVIGPDFSGENRSIGVEDLAVLVEALLQ